MQSRYLGRQWRKSNMKTVSAIYTKVRHRLNEDWAFGNGEFIKHLFIYGVSEMKTSKVFLGTRSLSIRFAGLDHVNK